jgi:hypothetical protein
VRTAGSSAIEPRHACLVHAWARCGRSRSGGGGGSGGRLVAARRTVVAPGRHVIVAATVAPLAVVTAGLVPAVVAAAVATFPPVIACAVFASIVSTTVVPTVAVVAAGIVPLALALTSTFTFTTLTLVVARAGVALVVTLLSRRTLALSRRSGTCGRTVGKCRCGRRGSGASRRCPILRTFLLGLARLLASDRTGNRIRADRLTSLY